MSSLREQIQDCLLSAGGLDKKNSTESAMHENLNGDIGTTLSASRSAFSCVIEYLKTPNLLPVVFQCLTAIVHRSFETAVQWLEERISEIGNDAVIIDSTLFAHACFLIKSMSLREEHIRDISVNLLTQLRNKFPQIRWNSSV